ncbi:M24 family metallopeptidase [Sphingomonas sp. MAH-20]|uniref:M24 family metallopeptidase n=1 Tax=Sphingomonas horti TaxID=2682842 RepID=A0A6I4J7U7_9SPHN|nr:MULTISPECIES: Xaa-Pro peptidase family protein [Sphingomonas]MBA2918888.1 aminopeptidase P family protein [Sphingomonas sp. CGMCC 1.13658]MVO78921.1 M24 family metallopeptidase [Sphingomonas horti]
MTKGIGGSTAARELAAIRPWTRPAAPIGDGERQARLEKARRLTAETGAGALLIGAGASLRYFTGISWDASERLVAMLLPADGRPIVIAPAFELGTLQAELVIDADIRLWQEDESPSALVADALRELGASVLAIDPSMALLFVERIRRASPSLDIMDASPIVDGCRMYKSPAELALLQQAKSMTLEVHRRAARVLRPGIRASEVTRFLDDAHRAIGAPGGNSFCIVQFGRSTAFPHGLPGDAELHEGDVVLIDTGCTIQGYHSDITRTYVFGEADAEQRRIWNLEKEAQAAAFDAAQPGRPCEDVDAAARRVLERAGLGPDYRLPGLPHRTGHGIGLSIHEPAYLVRGDRTPLAAGMCFSNEPMIVLPDRFGVRLEDHFYMTGDGPRWFTEPSPAIDAPFG